MMGKGYKRCESKAPGSALAQAKCSLRFHLLPLDDAWTVVLALWVFLKCRNPLPPLYKGGYRYPASGFCRLPQRTDRKALRTFPGSRLVPNKF